MLKRFKIACKGIFMFLVMIMFVVMFTATSPIWVMLYIVSGYDGMKTFEEVMDAFTEVD